MDFVVVSRKGVFVIEVKNWSDNFVRNYTGFSPHEQTDRAGRILWITLNDLFSKISVTNVLLSIDGNIPYNPYYRTVLVSSLDKINSFLTNRQDKLTDKQVKRIIGKLKWRV